MCKFLLFSKYEIYISGKLTIILVSNLKCDHFGVGILKQQETSELQQDGGFEGSPFKIM
ncbi:hypothetical protein DDB_G0270602 [Dictyostelium discoideum AX4]|uniref:Uncharacterized protein n=1 Tax=Dictyostelium discoideum TaxID=44689 RepID=Q55DG5_DICDI|nr:hypothetical protein DDB_G0270602 [Dictyostelium discoideum AX4]EAL72651.1 hypothetical protein DDB_G0270602 [Dictyostelium discoideum AX4]|eukprot:XP_646166.1 hypothetical protein DDB_G0270602 [Dictyostelium discoideum AX4]